VGVEKSVRLGRKSVEEEVGAVTPYIRPDLRNQAPTLSFFGAELHAPGTRKEKREEERGSQDIQSSSPAAATSCSDSEEIRQLQQDPRADQ
jgi:hypothetical protein